MSDMTTGELRGFIDTMRGGDPPRECVVTGTVVRVDPDGTAWVQIGSNAEPTPCARDMACHAGDEVTVRIADHKATVTGNASAPATDDHAANVAHGVASAAQHTADTAQATAQEADGRAQTAQRIAMTAKDTADAASTAAGEAKALAELTDQHFWTDTRGAHVTEAEREDYETQASGFQQLMTSIGTLLTRAVNGIEYLLRSDTASGMVVYDGECAADAQDLEDHVVGAFTKDGAQIGRKANAHVEMDFNSFKMVDKDGADFFVADDMRDETGVATITERFRGDGATQNFTVMFVPNAYVSATDSSHEGAAYTTSGRRVTFSVAPSDGATVTIVYKSSSEQAKAYTLGIRSPSSVIGPMSVAEGSYTTASGYVSHAEGFETAASGRYSHAEGFYAAASGQHSHAEGFYAAASGSSSHAEGYSTTASGNWSHAEGEHTVARGGDQHVQGRYNVIDTQGTYAHIVGNGTSDSNRSNAHTVDWSGNGWYAGEVKGSDCKSANYSLEDVGDSISQVTTSRATRSTSATAGGYIDYSRCGKQVIVTLSLNVTTLAANTVLGSGLPLPATNAHMPVVTGGSRSGLLYVDDATGRLIIESALPAAGWWVGSVPYFTA